jgi:hypothetical protein
MRKQFDDDEEDEKRNERDSFFQALSTFCNRYDPAGDETVTDYFSSKEIINIVSDHTGTSIPLKELYELLDQMKYKYILDDNTMMWMVRKA